MAGQAFSNDFRHAGVEQRGRAKGIESQNRAVLVGNRQESLRCALVVTLAGVPPEEIVQLGLAAVERSAVVFLAYRLFMPVGQAHDRSGMARAALRSFALGGGGVSRESQDAKAVALAEFDLFMLGNDRSALPACAVRRMNSVMSVCASATVHDEGLISGSDPHAPRGYSHSRLVGARPSSSHVHIQSVHWESRKSRRKRVKEMTESL